MQVARRVYVYLVTFISLQMLLGGASGLLRLLTEAALGISQDTLNSASYLREQFSLSGSIMLVGALVWIVHWMLAQRSVSSSNPDAIPERLSVLRKLLIYGVLFVAAWQVLFALAELLRDLALSVISTPNTDTDLGESLARSVPTLLVYGIAWLYYWRVAHNDNSLTPEDRRAATVRRWYFYLVNYGALSALMFAAADLARHLWRSLTGAEGSYVFGGGVAADPITTSAAWIVVSFAFWLFHWLAVQRLTRASEDEQRSVLRKVYLYLVVFQTLSVTMMSLAFLLNNALRLMLGTNPLGDSGDSLLTQAGDPLATALVYALFWAYHWQVLKWDASLVAKEPPRQASIRRAYHYLVALVGLAVLATGVATLLRLLMDLVLAGSIATDPSREAVGDQISLAATLIVVGGPVWYVNWLRLQRRALAPDGAAERHALLRRIYLYLILFFSVITLLISAGTVVYQVFLVLGGGSASDFMNNLADALGPTITASVLLAYHLRIIVADQRAFTATPPDAATEHGIIDMSAPPTSTILLVRSADASGVDRVVEEVRRKLPAGAQINVFTAPNLMPVELGAWLESRLSQQAIPTYASSSTLTTHQDPTTVQQTESPPPESEVQP
jgi:hypothetical protein